MFASSRDQMRYDLRRSLPGERDNAGRGSMCGDHDASCGKTGCHAANRTAAAGQRAGAACEQVCQAPYNALSSKGSRANACLQLTLSTT